MNIIIDYVVYSIYDIISCVMHNYAHAEQAGDSPQSRPPFRNS